jgi:hypothetical protein
VYYVPLDRKRGFGRIVKDSIASWRIIPMTFAVSICLTAIFLILSGLTTFVSIMARKKSKFLQASKYLGGLLAAILLFWVIQTLRLFPFVSEHANRLDDVYAKLDLNDWVPAQVCNPAFPRLRNSSHAAFISSVEICPDAERQWDEIVADPAMHLVWDVDFFGYEMPEVTDRPSIVYLQFFGGLLLPLLAVGTAISAQLRYSPQPTSD